MRNNYFKGINNACKTHGIYITFLLRSSFILPFFLVSYMMSVTDSKCSSNNNFVVRLRHYVIGNNGFVLPSLVYLYIGASAERLFAFMKSSDDGSEEEKNFKRLEVIILSVGAIVLTIVICLVGYLTRRELNRVIGTQEQRQEIELAERRD